MVDGDTDGCEATGAPVRDQRSEPSASGTVVYFGCGDLSHELGKIEQARGRALVPKTSIGRHAFIAHFIDSEGNRVALNPAN